MSKQYQLINYSSLGELAFMCLGRTSVFIINTALTVGCSLLVVVYILLFSKICVSFTENIQNSEHDIFIDLL